jgi:hypothetical protein
MREVSHDGDRRPWLPRLHRRSIGWITRAILVCALLVGVVGIIHGDMTDYHVDVETLAVLAALTGIYAERYAAASERRRAAIAAVQKELEDNIVLLQRDPRFMPQDHDRPEPHLYPRVAVAAAEACLAQGALTEDVDVDRARALTHWRDSAETFNRGVNLMELLFFGLHLITPDQSVVMLRVDEELQGQREKMITETQAVHDALRLQPPPQPVGDSHTGDVLGAKQERRPKPA